MHARAGTLDPSFGTGGTTFTEVAKGAIAYGTALQADGKVVVAGFVWTSERSGPRFGMARYDRSGRLDRTFGRRGVVLRKASWGAAEVVVQPDRRIVLVGGAFEVARYNPDGSLSDVFERGTWSRAEETVAVGATLQPDGKLVAVGARFQVGDVGAKMFVVRYRRDGRIDRAFGTDGSFAFGLPGSIDAAYDVAMAPDGSIIVAGWSAPAGEVQVMQVIRLSPAGELDFRTTPVWLWGRQASERGRMDMAVSVVVRPDGRILLAGDHIPANPFEDWKVVLVQLLPDGRLDPSFGSGGRSTPFADRPGSDHWAGDVVLQPDGTAILVGTTAGWTTPFPRGMVARIRADGSVDRDFGRDGAAVTAFPGRESDQRWLAAEVTPGGRILVAGWYCLSWEPCRFAVARYLGR